MTAQHRFSRRSGLYAASLVTIAMGFGVSGSALASTAGSTADATILEALNLTNVDGLHFGTILSSAAAGTVTMTPGGTRTCSAELTCTGGNGGAPANFDVSGTAGESYDITLPASTTLNDGGTESMTVDTFTHNAGEPPALDGTGADSFAVGAVINVGAEQVAGDYNGTFDVTVEYQ